MPFEIKGVGGMLRRSAAFFKHRVRFVERDVEDAHFARRGDVPGGAALEQSRRSGGQRNGARIFKAEQAAGEVRLAIAAQLEHERLVDPRQPDSAGHEAAGAVVDLATDNVFIDAPGHAVRLTSAESAAIRLALRGFQLVGVLPSFGPTLGR